MGANEVVALTSSERDGLVVLVIGAFALVVALLVIGFGWFAMRGLEVESAALPAATVISGTPLPVRPDNPTPTPRGGAGSPPPDSAPPPPEFPSATPDGYPGPIRGTPIPGVSPSPTREASESPPAVTPQPEETITIDAEPTSPITSPVASPDVTVPGSTPAATSTSAPPTTATPPLPPTATVGDGYPPPPTFAPPPTITPYPS